jgi:hypothetical protein
MVTSADSAAMSATRNGVPVANSRSLFGCAFRALGVYVSARSPSHSKAASREPIRQPSKRTVTSSAVGKAGPDITYLSLFVLSACEQSLGRHPAVARLSMTVSFDPRAGHTSQKSLLL